MILAGALVTSPRAEEKKVDWAPLPGASDLQRFMKYKSESGLLVLSRRCTLHIDTLDGVERDETLRVLVLDEKGVRGSSLQVNDREGATVGTVEGRTVLPDGKVLPLDPVKDVHRLEVATFKKKEPLESLARVDFPAPVAGALLDLHFTTKLDGPVYFYVDPVSVGQSTSLSTDYAVRVEKGYPGTQWSVSLLGGRSAAGQVTPKSLQELEAHYGVVIPGRQEPASVPFFHREPSLLAFLQWEDQDRESTAPSSTTISLDARGRLSGFRWAGAPLQSWWSDQEKELDDASARFLSKPGRARDIDVSALAPAGAPLERRLEALYRAAQDEIGYAPDATRQYYLTDVLRGGEDSPWQGTLLFQHLLERAGIPFKPCLIANRWGIRFSPVMTSTHLFGFTQAVRVEVPGKGPLYFVPGHLACPAWTLPYEYQDSVAIWREDKKQMGSGFTQEGSRELDRMEYRVEGAISRDGGFEGTVDLLERGAPGVAFREWYRLEEYRRAHPRAEDKKKRLSPEAQKELLEKRIREEISLDAPGVDLSAFSVVEAPSASDAPLHLRGSLRVPALAQPAQGTEWLVGLVPLLAGYRSPFSASVRETPIWYERSGRVVLDVLLRLPEGAQILELPAEGEFRGPQGAVVSFRASRAEEGGAVAVRAHLEFDRPLAVGTDEYSAWRAFESNLASRAESRCVASWSGAGALE